KIVGNEEFWSEANSEERRSFVANRHWVVRSIGRLLENGTKSDEHAFDPLHNVAAEGLLEVLLSRQEGERIPKDADAVSISINSPRGVCFEALLNLALRSCRLADLANQKDHSEAWSKFQPRFDAALLNPQRSGYEFCT